MVAPIGDTKDNSSFNFDLSDPATPPLYLDKQALKGNYLIQSDIFSLGIVLIEIDNYMDFDYDNLKYFQLIDSDQFPFETSFIDRRSIIYQIGCSFLKSNWRLRRDLKSQLEKLKKYNIKEININPSSESQEDFNLKLVQNLQNDYLIQMDNDEKTIDEKFNEIFNIFELQFDGEKQKLSESIDLLLKLLINIEKNPSDQIYRQIKYSNPTIQQKIFRLNHAREFLKFIGFEVKVENNEELYILEDKNLFQLFMFIQMIRNRLELFEVKQISQVEYERVVSIQNYKNQLHKKYVEDKKKEQEYYDSLKKQDRIEPFEIIIKDSIAPTFYQIDQDRNKRLLSYPIQNISGEQDFKRKVLDNPKPVIVEIYAGWCPPSRKLSEYFEMIQKNSISKWFTFAKVDSEDSKNQIIMENLGVCAYPTAFLFYNGQQVKEQKMRGLDYNKANSMLLKAVQISKK